MEDNRCNLLSWSQVSTWEQKIVCVITGEGAMRCMKLVQCSVTVTSYRLQAGLCGRTGFEFHALILQI